ncbi:hypothetical protein ASG72_04485 [Bosea sp. Leaf344]|uniref:retropepsin-like aspartic protease family protein n=1 Tax=Bosea sp. Leaf344 TaxID=1736346 RepID=UPI0006F89437|nr:TIGR02281 family clan AA aspartic protease [Bosea sp. Leaf344]KQU54871.1 hypothetical protein ASG72_04485 [Bosea sp. Leaf344]
MSQRPILWALGIAGSVALGAVGFSQRAASTLGLEPEPVPAAARNAGPADPTLTVAADYRGHYLVRPEIERFRIHMMVDTGASVVALKASDARALGIKPAPRDFTMSLSTANGAVRGARVTLREVRLGDIVIRNVEAVVLPEGALGISLLGNSFLRKLKGYEVQTGRMVLRG